MGSNQVTQDKSLRLVQVETFSQIDLVRPLFREYADSFSYHLCFQSFEQEIADLPGDYAPPVGRLYLAYWDENLAGCVALKELQAGVCEMKRFYVKPAFRRRGIGKILALHLIEEAKEMGYRSMRLDTLPIMQQAITLYRAIGFEEIAPCPNPIEGAIYMELKLDVQESGIKEVKR
jgi:putative acetyltransferase